MNNDILNADQYVTPEPVYTAEYITVAAHAIRVGDERDGRKVAQVKTGPKNTELLDADGKRIEYIGKDNGLLITRYSTTEDSVKAMSRARRNRGMAERLATRTDRVKAAQAKLNEALDRDGFADYSRVGELLAAQAELKLNHQFVGFATTDGKFVDLVEAQQKFVEHLTRQLITDTRHRALSRSSSVVSNLLEDCDREAIARYIDDVRWNY